MKRKLKGLYEAIFIIKFNITFAFCCCWSRCGYCSFWLCWGRRKNEHIPRARHDLRILFAYFYSDLVKQISCRHNTIPFEMYSFFCVSFLLVLGLGYALLAIKGAFPSTNRVIFFALLRNFPALPFCQRTFIQQCVVVTSNMRQRAEHTLFGRGSIYAICNYNVSNAYRPYWQC